MTSALLVPNEHLLIETLDHIQACPEDWYQANWRCGTSACFAGRAALLNGATWALDSGQIVAPMPEGGVRMDWCGVIRAGDGQIYADDVTWVDGDGQRFYQHVSAYARIALGLSGGAAADLFAATNSLGDLAGIVTRLTAEAVDRSM